MCYAPEEPPTPQCNPPYILVGGECCLDQNSDRICDRDKPPTTTTTSTTSTTTASTNLPVRYLTYSGGGISIKYPDTWRVEDKQGNSIVTVYAPPTGPLDNLNENLGVASGTDTDGILPIEDVRAAYEEAMPVLFTDYEMVDVSEANINGLPGYRHVFTMRQGMFTLKALQYYLLDGTDSYTLTYVALDSTYDDYITEVEEMVRSFTLA